jgi:hypothetical protein
MSVPPSVHRYARPAILAAAVATALTATALTFAPDALATSGHTPPHAPASERPPQDRLTVTVTGSDRPATNGTFELRCHPAGGTHRQADDACDALDELTTWGKTPFAPVTTGAQCTMQYGGPAKAHIEGRWAGRPVDADFSRANGCEMRRWDTLVPVLPRTGAPRPTPAPASAPSTPS